MAVGPAVVAPAMGVTGTEPASGAGALTTTAGGRDDGTGAGSDGADGAGGADGDGHRHDRPGHGAGHRGDQLAARLGGGRDPAQEAT